jgi:hypothetical protein
VSVRLPVVTCLCVSFDIDAHELQKAARGLQVSIEEIEGSMEVNGVSMNISRATGTAVSTLAMRLVNRWRIDSGATSVRIIECCGWTFASRFHQGSSQTLQWRITAGGELLWSTTDLRVATTTLPVPSVPQVAGCIWSTAIRGRVAQRLFIQASAQCDLDASHALDLMVNRLSRDTWQWQRRSSLVVQAERGSVQVQLTANPVTDSPGHPSSARSSIVMVESRPIAGDRQ